MLEDLERIKFERKQRKLKIMRASRREMRYAVESGYVPIDYVRSKMGTYDQVPEVDFVPYVGSFIGTISEWDLDKRIYKLNRMYERMKTDKEFANAIKEIKEITMNSFGSGRAGDRNFYGSFMVVLRKRIERQNELLENLIKSIDKNTRAVTELAKRK